jgi:hypothetical protein
VLGNRLGYANGVGFLEGVVSNHFAGNLAGYADQGNRIESGSGQAGYRIRGSRAAGGNADTHLAGNPGIAIGCMNRSLFMASQNDANIAGIVKSIEDGNDSAPRIPENGINLFPAQGFDYHFRSASIHNPAPYRHRSGIKAQNRPFGNKKRPSFPKEERPISRLATGYLFFLRHPGGDNNDGGNNNDTDAGAVCHDGNELITFCILLSIGIVLSLEILFWGIDRLNRLVYYLAHMKRTVYVGILIISSIIIPEREAGEE